MKRYIYLAIFAGATLFAEPSAFDAGVIDSDNPYGLTESERAIIENKKRSLSNQKLIRRQAIIIDQLQERVEGLSSVVDSISSKLGQTGQRLSQIDSESKKAGEEEINNLQSQIDELKKQNEENYKKLNQTLQKLSSIMGSSKTTAKHKEKSSSKEKRNAQKVLSNSELLKKAIKDFRAKNYSSAQRSFTKLAQKAYKPAKTNYYLGEIAYREDKFEDAISFYKTSVGYYDKASYMPTLLLHTALSFKRLGEMDNARQFFQTLVDSYPDSSEAKIAQKYLN